MDAAGLRDRGAPHVYDDDSQALSYTGDWLAQGTLSDRGDTHSTTDPGASVSLRFTGQGIAFVAAPGGSKAAISVDGQPQPDVQTSAFVGSGQTVFTGTSLRAGQHTITVTDVSGELAVGSFQVPARPYLNVASPASARIFPSDRPASSSTFGMNPSISRGRAGRRAWRGRARRRGGGGCRGW